ncbi:MAG TPA: hypothetical protein VL947_00590 [Cytophagales bacterium]|nr:hypothetical protein [Cytophagales bacterium]
MSSHLLIIGNHDINFQGNALSEIGEQVCKLLQSHFKFPNADFIIRQGLGPNQTSGECTHTWGYNIRKSVLYGGLEVSDYLQVLSSYGFSMIIEPTYILLTLPLRSLKHYPWFNYEKCNVTFQSESEYLAYQNEWSRLVLAIVEALGGHTAYMLADGSYDHNYDYGLTFSEIEKVLLVKCGPAQTSYLKMRYDPEEDETIPYLKIAKEHIEK